MKHYISTAFVIIFSFSVTAGCQTTARNSELLVAANEISVSEEFIFESSNVQLAATILTPKTANGLGVVMLPGSGPAERGTIRPAAEQMVRSGVTVLIFDKRGSGQSGGDWQKTSLDELAEDAIAAMAILRSRTNITRVGLWAHSQGNWVATRAAELGAEPTFLIAVSGGGVAPRETETYAYHHAVASAPPEDRQAAMEFVDSYFAYLSSEISRDALDALIQTAKTSNWYSMLGIENVLVSETYRAKWQWVADYDPTHRATERTFPTLVLLGGADHSIPLDQTIADWNQQLGHDAMIGNRINVFAGRDHHLRIPGVGHGHGVITESEIWSVIDHWLSEQVLN